MSAEKKEQQRTIDPRLPYDIYIRERIRAELPPLKKKQDIPYFPRRRDAQLPDLSGTYDWT